jgi:DNA-binding MarR family transcriptional regulator
MEDSIGYLLNDAARLYRREFNARARDVGFTALQWRLLHFLRRYPGIRQGPAAELIEVEPITLSRMVDRLQDSGLVERRADPADRRAWQLHLTEKAVELMAANHPISEQVNSAALLGISADEQVLLTKLVKRIQTNLSNRYQQAPSASGQQFDAEEDQENG